MNSAVSPAKGFSVPSAPAALSRRRSEVEPVATMRPPPARAALNAARAGGGRIVATGSTSLRLLESAAGADGTLKPFAGETALFITPGYRFRAADLLSLIHISEPT